MMARVIVCAALLGCGEAGDSDDAGARDGGDGLDGAALDGAVDGDAGPPGPCEVVCGARAARAEGTGATSFSPPGCAGGSFRLAWSYEMAGIDAAKSVPIVVDVNGDGRLDLVSNPRGLESAVVFFGTGGGTFGDAPTYLATASVLAGGWGADVGDIDGDDAPDVVAGDQNGGAIAWRNQRGAFVLARDGLPSGTFSGAGLADLNGDGALDAIFGADPLNDGFAVALGDGAGGWSVTGAPGIPSYGGGSGIENAGYFAFADADGDEDLDVFAFGQSSGAVSAFVYLNEGSASFSPAGDFGRGGAGDVGNPVQGGVGDVNCDGLPDVAAGSVVLVGNGASFTEIARVDDADVSHLGDLDGDGMLDLVTHSSSGGLRAYLNAGGGAAFVEVELGLPDETYVPGGLTTPIASAYGIDLADVDGDGDLDVVRSLQARHGYFELWVRE